LEPPGLPNGGAPGIGPDIAKPGGMGPPKRWIKSDSIKSPASDGIWPKGSPMIGKGASTTSPDLEGSLHDNTGPWGPIPPAGGWATTIRGRGPADFGTRALLAEGSGDSRIAPKPRDPGHRPGFGTAPSARLMIDPW